jgi:hypothetical protein
MIQGQWCAGTQRQNEKDTEEAVETDAYAAASLGFLGVP